MSRSGFTSTNNAPLGERKGRAFSEYSFGDSDVVDEPTSSSSGAALKVACAFSVSTCFAQPTTNDLQKDLKLFPFSIDPSQFNRSVCHLATLVTVLCAGFDSTTASMRSFTSGPRKAKRRRQKVQCALVPALAADDSSLRSEVLCQRPPAGQDAWSA